MSCLIVDHNSVVLLHFMRYCNFCKSQKGVPYISKGKLGTYALVPVEFISIPVVNSRRYAGNIVAKLQGIFCS